MAHDKFYSGFVDVIVFPAVSKMGETGQRLINGGHFKGWKIKNIFMPHGKFIGSGPQGGFGVAAGADDIQILAEGGPQVHR